LKDYLLSICKHISKMLFFLFFFWHSKIEANEEIIREDHLIEKDFNLGSVINVSNDDNPENNGKMDVESESGKSPKGDSDEILDFEDEILVGTGMIAQSPEDQKIVTVIDIDETLLSVIPPGGCEASQVLQPYFYSRVFSESSGCFHVFLSEDIPPIPIKLRPGAIQLLQGLKNDKLFELHLLSQGSQSYVEGVACLLEKICETSLFSGLHSTRQVEYLFYLDIDLGVHDYRTQSHHLVRKTSQ